MSNNLPVSVNIKQLSLALRAAQFLTTPFVQDLKQVAKFRKLAKIMRFQDYEVDYQLEREKEIAKERYGNSNGHEENKEHNLLATQKQPDVKG